MNFTDEAARKRVWWKIWQFGRHITFYFVLFCLYFYTYGFSETGIGNQCFISDPGATGLHHAN